MNQESAFNRYVLQKDQYILLHLIRYLSPSELRSLSSVNKPTQQILSRNKAFIHKAYLTAILQTKETERSTYYDRPEHRIKGKRIEFIIHKTGGPIMATLITRKGTDLHQRYQEARWAMNAIGQTMTEIRNGEIKDHQWMAERGLKREASKAMSEIGTLQEKIEHAQNMMEVHQWAKGDHNSIKKYLNRMDNTLWNELMTLDRITECRIYDETCGQIQGYRNLIENTAEDIVIEINALIRNIITPALMLWDGILQEQILELEKTKDRKEREQTTPIKMLPNIAKYLRNKDLMTIRCLDRTTEYWAAKTIKRIAHIMIRRLTKYLLDKRTGEAETTIILQLSRIQSAGQKYQMARRLIASRLENGTKKYRNRLETVEDLEWTLKSIQKAGEILLTQPSLTKTDIHVTKTYRCIGRLKLEVAYIDIDLKHKGKDPTKDKQILERDVPHMTRFTQQLTSEIKMALWAKLNENKEPRE